jgi:hypothetical protein
MDEAAAGVAAVIQQAAADAAEQPKNEEATQEEHVGEWYREANERVVASEHDRLTFSLPFFILRVHPARFRRTSRQLL